MKSYIWLYIFIIIGILTYKYVFVNNKKKISYFWNSMPVMHFDKEYPINKSIININYGYQIPKQNNIVLFDIKKDIANVISFLNDNYIDGYNLSEDYLYRKMSIEGSIGILYKINNVIVGFIQCSPYQFLNTTFSYVDLLCVKKSYRDKGLAKNLIENIIYYSPIKIFIHKKDKYPLPFNHFYKTTHYTCGIAYLKNKYGIKNTMYKPLLKRENNTENVFLTSDSIKTYYFQNNYISFALHKFKMIGILKIAEIFYISPGFNDYIDVISIMNENYVDFLVTLPNGIFKDKIDTDYYSKSMDLYVYTFNFILHPITDDLWLNIP
jgi:hypothetical protein